MPALENQVIEDEIEDFNIHTLVQPNNQSVAVFSAVKKHGWICQEKPFNDQIINSRDAIDP